MDSAENPRPPARLTSRDSGPGLRVSDHERDVVATELGEHFQAGRLNHEEFDERLALALGARTRGDLAELLADLPRQPKLPPTPAPSEMGPRSPAYNFVPLLFPLVFALIIVTGYAHDGLDRGGGPWPLLWLWWLIPLAIFRMRRGHR